MPDNKIINETAKTIEQIIAKNSTNNILFKGKILKLEEGGRVLVKTHKEAEISALLLMIGSAKQYQKTEIVINDDVLILQTQNSGNFALPIIINEDGQKGAYLNFHGVSLYETILEDFEILESGMTHIKDALENVKTTASSGVDPAFVSLSSSLVPMISGLESVITSIKSINSKIKKLV